MNRSDPFFFGSVNHQFEYGALDGSRIAIAIFSFSKPRSLGIWARGTRIGFKLHSWMRSLSSPMLGLLPKTLQIMACCCNLLISSERIVSIFGVRGNRTKHFGMGLWGASLEPLIVGIAWVVPCAPPFMLIDSHYLHISKSYFLCAHMKSYLDVQPLHTMTVSSNRSDYGIIVQQFKTYISEIQTQVRFVGVN